MIDERQLVRIASALGDETRFRILRAIADAGEIDCGDVTGMVGVAQSTVSHHVKALVQVGLVSVRQAGQRSLYRVVRERLREFGGSLEATFSPAARLPDLGWRVFD